jgi:hypothetical protein
MNPNTKYGSADISDSAEQCPVCGMMFPGADDKQRKAEKRNHVCPDEAEPQRDDGAPYRNHSAAVEWLFPVPTAVLETCDDPVDEMYGHRSDLIALARAVDQ